MRTTKRGIVIYEDKDKAPEGGRYIYQLGIMLNMIRKEFNKAAEAIDDLQEQIDKLKEQM